MFPGSSTAGDGGCNVDTRNQESDIPLRRRFLISPSCGVSSVIVFVVSLTLFVSCGQSALPSCLFPRLDTSHMSVTLSDTPFCRAFGGAGGGAGTINPRSDCATASLSMVLLSNMCLAIDDSVLATHSGTPLFGSSALRNPVDVVRSGSSSASWAW